MALLLPIPPPLNFLIQGPRGSCVGSYAPLYKEVTIDAPYYGFWSTKTIFGAFLRKFERFP